MVYSFRSKYIGIGSVLEGDKKSSTFVGRMGAKTIDPRLKRDSGNFCDDNKANKRDLEKSDNKTLGLGIGL